MAAIDEMFNFGNIKDKGFTISELIDHLTKVKDHYGDLKVELCSSENVLWPIAATLLTAGYGDLDLSGKPLPKEIPRRLVLIAMDKKFKDKNSRVI